MRYITSKVKPSNYISILVARETKAGQLVWQTYEGFEGEGVKLDVEKMVGLRLTETYQLRNENEELKKM